MPFTVTNTDTSLKTSNEGGDYAYTITTTSADGSSVSRPALRTGPRHLHRAGGIGAVDRRRRGPGRVPGTLPGHLTVVGGRRLLVGGRLLGHGQARLA
ncbi:hypothetical protein [Nonomuraea dietziae]|uniref:hypothetical protein n=1 Tax=Nonomuraea dietziae TaxID=65515 RepID=UPI0031D75517